MIHPATVFIVDDDRGLVRLIQKALAREGYETASAHSAPDALAWLREHRADLMLLDLNLDGVQANAVIEQLASIDRLIPFIIITGQGDERVAVEMMKRGAFDYLVKDVQFQELVPTIVRRALGQIDKDRQLAAAEQQRRQLEQQVLEIGDRERRRIGQDLHDGLGQHLTGIELMIQALEPKLPEKVKPDADKIAQHVREAIRQTRSLARGLSPVELEAHGLMSALHELAANVEDMFRVSCSFECAQPVLISDNAIATHLFRIAQEAVSNAIRHGQARQVTMTLRAAGEDIELMIRDNGRGIPEEPARGKGMGLRIIQYRAGVLGGRISIRAEEGAGTTVFCSVPRALVERCK